MEIDRRITWFAISTIALLLVVSIPGNNVAAADTTPAQSITDLTGLRVAVYYGTSLSTVNASRIAMIKMYELKNIPQEKRSFLIERSSIDIESVKTKYDLLSRTLV